MSHRKELVVKTLLLISLLVTLVWVSLTGIVFAQATPRFITLPARYLGNLQAPATPTITNWTGNIPGVGSVTMVGTDPSSTNGGCSVGGYHSSFGNAAAPQTYAHFTYIDKVGAFSQDVSALSHEVGEWMDGPFVNNAGCGGLLEVGDPLEGGPNFSGFPYTLNGFTYNLQDLVFLQYFGQTPSTSVNGWWSFQNASLSVCSNGQ